MRFFVVILLLTLGVNAQTIYVTDQNIFDLNPSRDALSGLEGAQRIRANFWEDSSYVDALDVTGGLPITLTVKSTVDDYTVILPNSVTSSPPNTVWWEISFLSAGQYRLQASITLSDDTFPIFDRYLTLTSSPAASAATVNLTVTNITTINYYGGSVTNLRDLS